MITWKPEKYFNETHTILIISQDAEMVAVWETLFHQKNYRVVSENSAENALQSSLLFSPALIVLELDLPTHEKLALCKGLRSNTQGTLLLLAAKESEMELSNYQFAGVDEFIYTPISPMALLIKCMAWLVRQEWTIPQTQSIGIYA